MPEMRVESEGKGRPHEEGVWCKAERARLADMSKVKEPVIDLKDDNFGCILNCAVRYAIGRQTYMPGLVIDFIRPLLPYLNDRTVYVFDQDVTERKYFGTYGDERIDEPYWMKFLEAVKEEEKRRGMDPYVDWRAQNGASV